MRWLFTPVKALATAFFLGVGTAYAALPVGWPNLAKPPGTEDAAVIIAAGWAPARDTLAAELAKGYRPGTGSPGSTGNPAYQAWLREWQWCELLSREEMAEAKRFLAPRLERLPSGLFSVAVIPNSKAKPAADLIEQAVNDPNFSRMLYSIVPKGAAIQPGQTLSALLPDDAQLTWTADPSFLRILLETLSPDDYTPQVLRNLAAIYRAEPKKFHDYLALAVALAVVYDVRTPSVWPHHQVAPSLVPKKDESVANRFTFWAKSNESSLLLTDLRQLPAEQLKFVVDAPLDDAELLWAQNNAPHGRAEFAKTFSDITYDTHRLVNNVLNWDKGSYTLESIQRNGGICVDQAYFAFVCGKAVGLPTLFFDGQTKDGGHAWFGYLKATNQWAMDCGRYESMGILTGKAFDPQTWDYITDHELAFLTEAFHQQPAYAASCGDLAMAHVFATLGDKARQAKALDSAIAVCPRNSDAWDAKANFLKSSGANYTALRTHYEAAIRQFGKDADLKVDWQTALIDLASQSGDTTTANGLQRQIISQNQASRADLALNAAAEKIGALINARDLTGAAREFQLQAGTLGRNAGGNLYYHIAEPLALALYYSGDQPGAKKTVQTVRDILKPAKNEILDVDISRVEKTISTPLKPVLIRK